MRSGISAENRPQVRTKDGFVLRRTGGYKIYELALLASLESESQQLLLGGILKCYGRGVVTQVAIAMFGYEND
jgi:hypothetical protein